MSFIRRRTILTPHVDGLYLYNAGSFLADLGTINILSFQDAVGYNLPESVLLTPNIEIELIRGAGGKNEGVTIETQNEFCFSDYAKILVNLELQDPKNGLVTIDINHNGVSERLVQQSLSNSSIGGIFEFDIPQNLSFYCGKVRISAAQWANGYNTIIRIKSIMVR